MSLLGHRGTQPNHLDNKGRNALSWAASEAQPALVDILLKDSRIDPNNIDSVGWTPLIYGSFRDSHFLAVSF